MEGCRLDSLRYPVMILFQIAKTLGSTLIRYRSDAKAADRYQIDVDPRVSAVCTNFCCSDHFCISSSHQPRTVARLKSMFWGMRYFHSHIAILVSKYFVWCKLLFISWLLLIYMYIWRGIKIYVALLNTVWYPLTPPDYKLKDLICEYHIKDMRSFTLGKFSPVGYDPGKIS